MVVVVEATAVEEVVVMQMMIVGRNSPHSSSSSSLFVAIANSHVCGLRLQMLLMLDNAHENISFSFLEAGIYAICRQASDEAAEN